MFDLEDLMRLLSGALTPVIAIIAAYIAYQQFLTNRRKGESDAQFAKSKQRFDLYDRRLAVFNAAMDLIATVQHMPPEEIHEPLFTFHRAISESYFLFDQDILDYLQLLNAKYNQFSVLNRWAASPMLPEGDKGQQRIDDALALQLWFGDQFDEARRKFSKYLFLREIATPSI
jgi:hypothetical protein